jgi:hypothetical protein
LSVFASERLGAFTVSVAVAEAAVDVTPLAVTVAPSRSVTVCPEVTVAGTGYNTPTVGAAGTLNVPFCPDVFVSVNVSVAVVPGVTVLFVVVFVSVGVA